MIKKRIQSSILVVLVAACCFTLVGCTEADEAEIHSKQYQFTNLSDEYNIKANSFTTYYKGEGNIPYLDVKEFTQNLNGFLDAKYLSYSLNKMKNTYEIYWRSGFFKYSFLINYEQNTVKVNDINFFNLTIETAATNYGRYLKTVDWSNKGSKAVTFDLEAYQFDIYYYQGKILMPYIILNTLFCSNNMYNIYFNNDAYYGVWGHIPRAIDNVYNTVKVNSLNGVTPSNEVREATYQHLMFTLDYFYGLKKEKGINSFKEYLSPAVKADLMSLDPNVYTNAYTQLLHKQLDELHTNISVLSYYHQPNEIYPILDENNMGDFWKQYYSLSTELNNALNEHFPERIPPLRYINNTAIIYFESFETALDSYFEIYGEEVWKYDTDYFFRHVIAELKQHLSINKIIIDLTTNGGGNMGALYRSLGFLTDQEIVSAMYNTLSQAYVSNHFITDTNGDGVYENDAYNAYDWYVLTSLNTFSAANYFTAIAKNMEIATIIGEQSGGGMCTVLPIVLADGTSIRISSPDSLQYIKQEGGNQVFYPVENGITPDYILSKEFFYNDQYLDNFINNL